MRLQDAFDVERVTKKFYDEFQGHHAKFLERIEGIEDDDDREWYASVMLNRLMFIYFVQKKGFLDGDTDYLSDRLNRCQSEDFDYYRGFLLPLFFEGFCLPAEERTADTNRLLGEIPYLNGGLFLPHPIEQACGVTAAGEGTIGIADEAFEDVFAFFNQYQWYLDDRPLRNDREINPDVLGYIFEKYINQKELGAYYTKEDITGYIARNTVLPLLFDELKSRCHDAVEPLPVKDIEPYIYPSVSQEDFLPTETEREREQRLRRCEQIRADFADGKIASINDFITYNLDIEQFAQDFVIDCDDPRVIHNLYFECIKKLSVLDPTCGSGAFLFAALNILEPLYDLCLMKMEDFVTGGVSDQWAKPFRAELDRIEQHPNRPYFIFKSIIVNNLFGVDIMEEAIEICKLRLFLKLAAQVDDPGCVEPLPDIDFNIRAGNTLVGYATYEEIESAKAAEADTPGRLDYGDVQRQTRLLMSDLERFRHLQMEHDFDADLFAQEKERINRRLAELNDQLSEDLRIEYGAADKERFLETHKPFHWCIEFNDIMESGGFDVVIGNPPYVKYSSVADQYTIAGYETADAPDIYAYVLERSTRLLGDHGRGSMIVPLNLTFSRDFVSLRALLLNQYDASWLSSYDNIPAALFTGVSQRCTIWVGCRQNGDGDDFVAPMYRWRSSYRPVLLENAHYTPWQPPDRDVSEIPKFASLAQGAIYNELRRSEQLRPTRFQEADSDSSCRFAFSTTARNFVSSFISDPPCFDAASLTAVPQSQVAEIQVGSEDMALSTMASCAGHLFLWYWLVRGDGFHVTKTVVRDFCACLNAVPDEHYSLLVDLGELLHEHRDEALVFKKNAGRYVGNYNYGSLRSITHRADLVLLAGLDADSEQAWDILRYVDRVLSINVHAGEKAIPPEVRELIPPTQVDRQLEAETLAQADRLVQEHFGFTDQELDYIINYDIKYRMGGT